MIGAWEAVHTATTHAEYAEALVAWEQVTTLAHQAVIANRRRGEGVSPRLLAWLAQFPPGHHARLLHLRRRLDAAGSREEADQALAALRAATAIASGEGGEAGVFAEGAGDRVGTINPETGQPWGGIFAEGAGDRVGAINPETGQPWGGIFAEGAGDRQDGPTAAAIDALDRGYVWHMGQEVSIADIRAKALHQTTRTSGEKHEEWVEKDADAAVRSWVQAGFESGALNNGPPDTATWQTLSPITSTGDLGATFSIDGIAYDTQEYINGVVGAPDDPKFQPRRGRSALNRDALIANLMDDMTEARHQGRLTLDGEKPNIVYHPPIEDVRGATIGDVVNFLPVVGSVKHYVGARRAATSEMGVGGALRTPEELAAIQAADQRLGIDVGASAIPAGTLIKIGTTAVRTGWRAGAPTAMGGGFVKAATPADHVMRLKTIRGPAGEEAVERATKELLETGTATITTPAGETYLLVEDPLSAALRKANPGMQPVFHVTPTAGNFTEGAVVQFNPGKGATEQGLFVSPDHAVARFADRAAYGATGDTPGILAFDARRFKGLTQAVDEAGNRKYYRDGYEVELVFRPGSDIPEMRAVASAGGPKTKLYTHEGVDMPSYRERLSANVRATTDQILGRGRVRRVDDVARRADDVVDDIIPTSGPTTATVDPIIPGGGPARRAGDDIIPPSGPTTATADPIVPGAAATDGADDLTRELRRLADEGQPRVRAEGAGPGSPVVTATRAGELADDAIRTDRVVRETVEFSGSPRPAASSEDVDDLDVGAADSPDERDVNSAPAPSRGRFGWGGDVRSRNRARGTPPDILAPREEPDIPAPREEPDIPAPREELDILAPREEPDIPAPREEPDIPVLREVIPDIPAPRDVIPTRPSRGRGTRPAEDLDGGRVIPDLPEMRDPIPDLPEMRDPIPDLPETRDPIPDLPETRDPIPDLPETRDVIPTRSSILDGGRVIPDTQERDTRLPSEDPSVPAPRGRNRRIPIVLPSGEAPSTPPESGKYPSSARYRVLSDVAVDLHTGKTQSEIVESSPVEVYHGADAPAARRRLKGRNVDLVIGGEGQVEGEEIDVRDYSRAPEHKPYYNPGEHQDTGLKAAINAYEADQEASRTRARATRELESRGAGKKRERSYRPRRGRGNAEMRGVGRG